MWSSILDWICTCLGIVSFKIESSNQEISIQRKDGLVEYIIVHCTQLGQFIRIKDIYILVVAGHGDRGKNMLTSVSAFPDHLTVQVLLSWIFGKKKSAAFSATNIFNKKTRIQDIFRYLKNPPGLKYNDQKGGQDQVKRIIW